MICERHFYHIIDNHSSSNTTTTVVRFDKKQDIITNKQLIYNCK